MAHLDSGVPISSVSCIRGIGGGGGLCGDPGGEKYLRSCKLGKSRRRRSPLDARGDIPERKSCLRTRRRRLFSTGMMSSRCCRTIGVLADLCCVGGLLCGVTSCRVGSGANEYPPVGSSTMREDTDDVTIGSYSRTTAPPCGGAESSSTLMRGGDGVGGGELLGDNKSGAAACKSRRNLSYASEMLRVMLSSALSSPLPPSPLSSSPLSPASSSASSASSSALFS